MCLISVTLVAYMHTLFSTPVNLKTQLSPERIMKWKNQVLQNDMQQWFSHMGYKT